MADILRGYRTGALLLLALAAMSVPGQAQSSWRAIPMRYDSAKVEWKAPEFAWFTDPAAALMSLPPLHLAELPDGAEEIRIWNWIGLEVPNVLLRLTQAEGPIRGEVVYWWQDHRDLARDTSSAHFLAYIKRWTGAYGCNEGKTGKVWHEHRGGEEIEHRNWVFTCKLDLGGNEPNWDVIRARLVELRVFDLPDPSTLEPKEKAVSDGIDMEGEIEYGISIGVEVLQEAHYHTYKYRISSLQPWPEATFARRIFEFVSALIRNLDRP